MVVLRLPRVPRPSSLAGAACAALLCVVILVSAATGSARPRAASKAVPQGFVGMVVDEPVWPDAFVDLGPQLDKMVQSGVQTVRVVFDWASFQPYKRWKDVPKASKKQFTNVGGIPTDFSSADELVTLASQRGLTVMPVILDAPGWAGKSYKGGIMLLPRSDAQYATFAKTLVQRYGPRGSLWKTYRGARVPIRSWQIWNEPNIPAFWPPQPYYSRYVSLLRAAHDAIKSADPSAKVVLAGLPNFSWIELARLYKFRGARKLFDVVAVHPYTKTPHGVITILQYVRDEMNLAGDTTKPMIADEISWPSSQGETTHNTGYDFATTEQGQAQNLSKLLPTLVKDRARLGLAGFYYYDWAGLDRPNYLAFDFSGLFRISDGSFIAKPAFAVFKRDALAMEDCRAKGSRATICLR
jgi:hypothetical protein